MTLHVLHDLEQGSDAWHDQRRGMVTASVVGKLITAKTLKPASNDISRSITALLTAERITGWTDPTYVTDDMLRGKESEPLALDAYSKHHAPVTTCGLMVLEQSGWRLGYSSDGLVGDEGLIEVKAPRAKNHLTTIIKGAIPPEHMAQCQAGLFVSGRKWLDFVSYVGGMPIWVKRVYPNPQWFEAIVAAVEKFEENSAELIAIYKQETEGLPMTERIPELGGLGELKLP